MGKRTSPNDLAELDDLNDLSRIVKDKRQHKRASEKKGRRNRHYVKLLIKQQTSCDNVFIAVQNSIAASRP